LGKRGPSACDGGAGSVSAASAFDQSVLFSSLYDIAPMRDRSIKLIDFVRLNGGEIRISVATTDVETSDPVIFDSKTCRIEIDHLLSELRVPAGIRAGRDR
jgi:hypothetical protein